MMETSDVHRKVYSGAAWMVSTRLLVKSIGLVSSVILARLLVPEDFGLVAIAMAFYAFVELFGAVGFGTAIIHRSDATDSDDDTAFTFNFYFGVLAAVIIFLLAPGVAEFYADPRLKPMLQVIALSSFLSGCTNIGVIRFQRDMNFRRELVFQLLPKIISFCVTLSLAFIYRNYWALVIGSVFSQFLVVIISYLMHSYRPSLSLSSFDRLFSFSRWLMLNNFVTFINLRLSELYVAATLPTSSVGYLSLGQEIAVLPFAQIAKPINKATFPVYSRLKEDIGELRAAYLNTKALMVSLTLPASLGIALVAPALVTVVLGEAWTTMVPLLQLLAIAGFLNGLTANSTQIYVALGRPDITVAINGLRTILFLPLMVILIGYFGLLGVGSARLIVVGIMVLVVQWIMSRFLNVSLSDFFDSIKRPLAGCAVMLSVLLIVRGLVFTQYTVLDLLMLILLGAVSYGTAVMLIWSWQGYPPGFEQAIVSEVAALRRRILRAWA